MKTIFIAFAEYIKNEVSTMSNNKYFILDCIKYNFGFFDSLDECTKCTWNNKLVIDTLNEAISKRKDVQGLIIHSDQGFQYTSFEYKSICKSNGITISMSRKGTPIDDSPMESWHGILKKETLHNNNITSLQEYQKLVEEWILFYNTDRLKSKKLKK